MLNWINILENNRNSLQNYPSLSLRGAKLSSWVICRVSWILRIFLKTGLTLSPPFTAFSVWAVFVKSLFLAQSFDGFSYLSPYILFSFFSVSLRGQEKLGKYLGMERVTITKSSSVAIQYKSFRRYLFQMVFILLVNLT